MIEQPLIAIIEDEEHLAHGLIFNLEADGYRTHHEAVVASQHGQPSVCYQRVGFGGISPAVFHGLDVRGVLPA